MDQKAMLEELIAIENARWMKRTGKLWRNRCALSLRAEEDEHCAHAAETYHQFMRGKVTANQTKTQADQQIAFSPALRAECSSLDRTTDGQQRKYDHSSSAANAFLSLPQQYKTCWKISLEPQALHLLSSSEKGMHFSEAT